MTDPCWHRLKSRVTRIVGEGGGSRNPYWNDGHNSALRWVLAEMQEIERNVAGEKQIIDEITNRSNVEKE